MYNVWLQSTTLKSPSIFFTSIFLFSQSIPCCVQFIYVTDCTYIHTIDSISTRESQGIIHTRERSHFLFLTVGSMKGKCVIPGVFNLKYQSRRYSKYIIAIIDLRWGGVWGLDFGVSWCIFKAKCVSLSVQSYSQYITH